MLWSYKIYIRIECLRIIIVNSNNNCYKVHYKPLSVVITIKWNISYKCTYYVVPYGSLKIKYFLDGRAKSIFMNVIYNEMFIITQVPSSTLSLSFLLSLNV